MRIVSEILLAILNSLWQAVLVAAMAWVVLRLFKKMNAATRYAIWWAVLGVVLALPLAPTAASGIAGWWHRRAQAPQAAAAKRAAPVRTVIPLAQDAPAMLTLRPERASRWPLWIAGLWAAVCAFRLWQIARSYLYLRGVKRRAALWPERLTPLSRPARLLISQDVSSPMAVGFLHPAVILPEGLPEQLAGAELEHVLLHESAHLARWDDWSNLLAKLAGAALALHPVAGWILRQIGREREIACDDWVVERTGAARPYAASLARMSELLLARRQRAPGEALAAGIFGGGSRFAARIELLLERGREFSARASKARVAATVMALGAAMMLAPLAPQWIAFAQAPLRFDVASVRPVDDSKGYRLTCQGGRQFEAANSLRNLVYFAYEPGDAQRQIVGGPPWIDSRDPLFAVEAKPPSPPVSSEDCRKMVQTLLAERFKLALHKETREMPVYALVVGGRGSKLHEAGPEEPKGLTTNILINGDTLQVNDNFSRSTGRGMTMPQVARFCKAFRWWDGWWWMRPVSRASIPLN